MGEVFLASPLQINHWSRMSEQTSEMDEHIMDQGGGIPALVSLRETTQALWDCDETDSKLRLWSSKMLKLQPLAW